MPTYYASTSGAHPPPPGLSFPPGQHPVGKYYFIPLYFVCDLSFHNTCIEHYATIQEYTLVPGPSPTMDWGAKFMIVRKNGEEKLLPLPTDLPQPEAEREEEEHDVPKGHIGHFMDCCSTTELSMQAYHNCRANRYSFRDDHNELDALYDAAMANLQADDVRPKPFGVFMDSSSTEDLSKLAGQNMYLNKIRLRHSTFIVRISAIVARGFWAGLARLFKRRKGHVKFSPNTQVHTYTAGDNKPKKRGVRFADVEPESEQHLMVLRSRSRDLMEAVKGNQCDLSADIADQSITSEIDHPNPERIELLSLALNISSNN